MNNKNVDTTTGSAVDWRNETRRPNVDGVGQNDVETRSSINELPDEILRAIILSLDGRDWPRVELISRRFHSCVLDCWESLKIVRLEEFCDNALIFSMDDSGKQDLLQHLLRMVYDRSPNVQAISGFSAFVSKLESRTLEYLTHFQNLKSVTFFNCTITTAELATFLNNSNSRNELEELCITGSLTFSTFESFMDVGSNREDELLLQALLNTPDGPALRLKKFGYEKNDCCKGSFLAGLDTSRLEILSLATSSINLHCVAELLGRCMELQEFRFDGMITVTRVEIDPRSVEAFLNAIVSLPTISLRKLELCGCTSNDNLLSSTLSQVGRRHDRLRSLCIHDNVFPMNDCIVLAIGEYFSSLTTLEMDLDSVEKGDLAQLMTRMGRLNELGFYYSDPLGIATPEDKERIVDCDVVRAIASNVRGLISLRLYDVVITPENAEMLTQMKELKQVSIHWAGVGDEAITWWCNLFGSLIIRLEMYSQKLTDSLILFIVSRLTRVRRLLLGATRITDTALYAIANSCPSLEELLLGYVKHGTLLITASGVQDLIHNCKKLTYVEVCKTSFEMKGIVMNRGTRLVVADDIRAHLFWAWSYLARAYYCDDDYRNA